MMRKKIEYETFKRLLYQEKWPYQKIANFFNVSINTVNSYRFRNFHPRERLPPWNKNKKGLQVAWNKGKTVPQIQKEKNPNWKGGKYKTRFGYIRIRVDNHPFAYENYVLEHRFVMESFLKRYLKKNEIIHHINGVKTDNRIENLELFKNKSVHAGHHSPKGSRIGINKKL